MPACIIPAEPGDVNLAFALIERDFWSATIDHRLFWARERRGIPAVSSNNGNESPHSKRRENSRRGFDFSTAICHNCGVTRQFDTIPVDLAGRSFIYL
jgi:hypothetical protein